MPTDPSPESLAEAHRLMNFPRLLGQEERVARALDERDARIAELAKLMKRIVFEGLTHNGQLIPSDALRSAIVSAKEALDA